MSALDLARWQFGITTVYHFLFVPITLGTSFLVAGMQTAWVRTNDEKWLRATKFFGKIFLINFAMGVVTGIVQEFQFGMNWSTYSRFVGDIFGAPLAIEGLLAFFMESTFLGAWIFGWDRLPKKVHLAMIWLAAIGTMISAIFILPFVLFSLPSGVWLDRVRKLPVYVAGELLLAAVVSSVPLAWWMGWLAMPWLYVVAFVTGTLNRWTSVRARPIAIGAKPAGARRSVAPMMTNRNIAVATISQTSAATRP